MKYVVTKNVVWILGRIWMPPVLAAQTLELDEWQSQNAIDRANYEEGGKRLARQDLEEWLNLHCGDFQEIVDFSASLEIDGETVEIPWKDEANEMQFNECIDPQWEREE